MSGTIPPELGNLSSLQLLSLRDNQLSGSIPSALGNLTNLEVLRLRNNQFSGCIPDGLRDAEEINNDLDSLGLPDCG